MSRRKREDPGAPIIDESGQAIHDPDNYKKLNVPFESVAAMDEAVASFTEGVRLLRNTYKIADVYIIVRVEARNEKGVVGHQISTSHFGNLGLSELLTAVAYGFEKRKHEEVIRRALGED